MADSTDKGSSPTQETGVGEVTGPLRGNQLYEVLLAREKSHEAQQEEVVEVPDKVTEEIPEVPEEQESPESEPAVDEDQSEEEEEIQPEEDDDEVLSQSSEEEEEPPRIPLKRLNKEVARRKDLEERLERAKARIAEMEAAPQKQPEPVQPVADVLPNVSTPEELERLQSESEDVVDYIESKLTKQPDGMDDSGNEVYTTDGGKQYTKEELGDMLINARRRLRREIPKKRQFLQQAQMASSKALEVHPWLADNTSNEYQTFRAIQASRPWIEKMDPAGVLLVAAMVEGIKVINSRQSGTKPKVAVKKQVAPPVDTVSATPKKVIGNENRTKRRQAREAKIMSKGKLTSRDLQEVFLQRELDRTE